MLMKAVLMTQCLPAYAIMLWGASGRLCSGGSIAWLLRTPETAMFLQLLECYPMLHLCGCSINFGQRGLMLQSHGCRHHSLLKPSIYTSENA